MKILFIPIVFFLLLTVGCKVNVQLQTLLKHKSMIPIDSSFEKFDIDMYDNRISNPAWHEKQEVFIMANGIIYQSWHQDNEYEQIEYPSLPKFYKIRKEYYTSGFIKRKGLDIGAFSRENSFLYGIEIGIWYYFDGTGKLIKKLDEDLKFGKFGYNELLNFLDKEHVINLRTGENREELKIFFDEKEKFWTVEVYTKVKAHIENGERNIDTKDGFGYKIEGHTGKVLYKRKQHYIQSMGLTEFEYIIKEPRQSIIL